MRVILFLFVFLLFLNCEDKQSKKKMETNIIETKETIIKTPTEDTKEEPETDFPILDDKNAVPFFAEYDKKHKENKVRITTDFGAIDILLYNDTKYHRSNFIYLTKRQYYVDTQFYRVIDNFMIQAGNSDDKKIAKKRSEIGQYLLPTDTKKGYKHNRGVISMPSSDIENPYKLASPFEFFIVQQQGGAPHLDGDFTIFGEVTKGMDVVDKIAAVETDDGDWPLNNIYIRKVEIIE
ncbi:peptidylprolyl isomerase [Confluentibacter citreus]|uniref:peptidylprolyl isomerase n=1 Tax=Confluentibacter citreus TaxID=2007307 RepID=UPI000C284312|nr:peptidylprolyl isomerase [Confluentibacter citreus]